MTIYRPSFDRPPVNSFNLCTISSGRYHPHNQAVHHEMIRMEIGPLIMVPVIWIPMLPPEIPPRSETVATVPHGRLISNILS